MHGVLLYGYFKPWLVFFHLGDSEKTSVTLASTAVTIFFVISGYLITASWIKKPAFFLYASNRVLRIVPGLIVNLLITFILLLPFCTDADFSQYYHQLFSSGTIPTVFRGNPDKLINGSLWTLGIEAWMYLLVGMIGTLTRKYPVLFPWFIGFFTILIFDAAVRTFDYTGETQACAFCLGSLAFYARQYIPWLRSLALAAVSVLVCVYLYEQSMPLAVKLALYLLAMTYLVLYIAFMPSRLSEIGRHGDFSYGIYIYGWPVTQAVYYHLAPINMAAYLAISAMITFALAFFSWHLIEKYALRLKPSTLRKDATIQ